MKNRGITLSASGDLSINNGKMVIGDTSTQIIAIVINMNKGELKEYPLLGGDAKKMMGGTAPPITWTVEAKQMINDCGVTVSNVSVDSDGTINIE